MDRKHDQPFDRASAGCAAAAPAASGRDSALSPAPRRRRAGRAARSGGAALRRRARPRLRDGHLTALARAAWSCAERGAPSRRAGGISATRTACPSPDGGFDLVVSARPARQRQRSARRAGADPARAEARRPVPRRLRRRGQPAPAAARDAGGRGGRRRRPPRRASTRRSTCARPATCSCRAGFALPVVDRDADRRPLLVAGPAGRGSARDGRRPTSCARRSRRPIDRLGLAAAAADFARPADGNVERFEILYLSGWAPAPDQPQPARRGSATASLADALKSARRAGRSAARRRAAFGGDHLAGRSHLSALASSGRRLAPPSPAQIEEQDHVPPADAARWRSRRDSAPPRRPRCRAPRAARGPARPRAVRPASTLPPGNSHRPAIARPGARCCSRTRPSPSSKRRRHHRHCRNFFQMRASLEGFR